MLDDDYDFPVDDANYSDQDFEDLEIVSPSPAATKRVNPLPARKGRQPEVEREFDESSLNGAKREDSLNDKLDFKKTEKKSDS